MGSDKWWVVMVRRSAPVHMKSDVDIVDEGLVQTLENGRWRASHPKVYTDTVAKRCDESSELGPEVTSPDE